MKWTTALAALNLGDRHGRASTFVKGNLQSSEPTQAKIVTPGDRLVWRECQLRRAARNRFERQLAFNAGKRRAETKVTGPTKSQMPIVRARNVETIRIGKAFGIAIAGGHHRNHSLAFAN